MTSDKNLSVEFIGRANKVISDNSLRNYLSQKKQTSRSSVLHKSEKLIAYKKSTNKIPNDLLIGSCKKIPKYMQIMKMRGPNEFNRKYHKLIHASSLDQDKVGGRINLVEAIDIGVVGKTSKGSLSIVTD